MIVDFTVSNFRSIRDETTISFFVEHPGTHLTENVSYPSGDKIGVVKSAGIYGANASGKSNLLLVFAALEYIISESGNLKDGDSIRCYEPFRLSPTTRNAPIRFEVEFVVPEGTRYRYKVAFNKYRIVEEQLIAYPSKQPALLFERKESDTWDTIKFGTTFKGGKKRLPFFPNNAYLSKAGNSADAPELVRNVYNYFRMGMVRIAPDERIIFRPWVEDRDIVKLVSDLLCFADTEIDKVVVTQRDISKLKLPADMPDDLKEAIRWDYRWKIAFSHKTETGDIELFEPKDESAGTLRLFRLAPIFIDALTTGGVVLVDELESSMHPFMAELIIKMFNDPEVNPKGAQLIFTTHNVNIMSPELLRREQVWFVEKESGASRYYSLRDFDKSLVKPTTPFNRWYLDGRFDAIPKIDYQKIMDLLKASRATNAKEKK